MSNATSFGRQSTTYAKGRPGYPTELYDWINANSPDTQRIWDVGCGSGQASRSLTNYFSHVYATDISAKQIEAATPHPNIDYAVSQAHESGLPENWADTITVATAVHWFAEPVFWDEVQRVGKCGCLFSAWTYQLPLAPADVMNAYLTPIYELIDPFWAEGNRICMTGYNTENLKCPLLVLETPELTAKYNWTAIQIADFAQSWSAHFRARENGHAERLKALRDNFLERYTNQEITISLPMSIFAARIG